MGEAGPLAGIFERLACAQPGAAAVFGADEVERWADGSLEALVGAGLLNPAPPAQVIECDGCERNCFMPVYVRPVEDDRPARAFISCDKPEDLGRVPVPLDRLRQWRIAAGMLAGAVARLLGFTLPPQEDGARGIWTLGLLRGKEHLGAVTLSLENGGSLAVAGQSVPLTQVLTLSAGALTADRDALIRMVEGAEKPNDTGGVPAAQRSQIASNAAKAKHRKSGIPEKKKQLREIWAKGHYTSHMACAEQECEGLGLLFDTGMKALRNAPEPKRSN